MNREQNFLFKNLIFQVTLGKKLSSQQRHHLVKQLTVQSTMLSWNYQALPFVSVHFHTEADVFFGIPPSGFLHALQHLRHLVEIYQRSNAKNCISVLLVFAISSLFFPSKMPHSAQATLIITVPQLIKDLQQLSLQAIFSLIDYLVTARNDNCTSYLSGQNKKFNLLPNIGNKPHWKAV